MAANGETSRSYHGKTLAMPFSDTASVCCCMILYNSCTSFSLGFVASIIIITLYCYCLIIFCYLLLLYIINRSVIIVI